MLGRLADRQRGLTEGDATEAILTIEAGAEDDYLVATIKRTWDMSSEVADEISQLHAQGDRHVEAAEECRQAAVQNLNECEYDKNRLEKKAGAEKAAFEKAGAAFEKAGAAFEKAGAAFEKAGAAVVMYMTTAVECAKAAELRVKVTEREMAEASKDEKKAWAARLKLAKGLEKEAKSHSKKSFADVAKHMVSTSGDAMAMRTNAAKAKATAGSCRDMSAKMKKIRGEGTATESAEEQIAAVAFSAVSHVESECAMTAVKHALKEGQAAEAEFNQHGEQAVKHANVEDKHWQASLLNREEWVRTEGRREEKAAVEKVVASLENAVAASQRSADAWDAAAAAAWKVEAAAARCTKGAEFIVKTVKGGMAGAPKDEKEAWAARLKLAKNIEKEAKSYSKEYSGTGAKNAEQATGSAIEERAMAAYKKSLADQMRDTVSGQPSEGTAH